MHGGLLRPQHVHLACMGTCHRRVPLPERHRVDDDIGGGERCSVGGEPPALGDGRLGVGPVEIDPRVGHEQQHARHRGATLCLDIHGHPATSAAKSADAMVEMRSNSRMLAAK